MSKRIPMLLVVFALGVGAGLLGGGLGVSSSEAPASWDMVDRNVFAVSHIVFRPSANRSGDQVEELVALAHRKVTSGGDFAEVARAQSDDPSADMGGFLGWIEPNDSSAFIGAVMALRPGQISQPVFARGAWHIIKRHAFEEALALERSMSIPTYGFFVTFAGTRGVPSERSRNEAQRLAEEAAAAIRAGTLTLEEAHRRFVPEQQQKSGGWLGMTADSGEQRPVYQALKDAPVGEVVGPVSTAYGWAVVARGRYLRTMVKQILVQHVLVKGRELSISRTPDEARALAEQALREVLADPSRWDEAVGRYSDDRQSIARGGYMGVLHPGEMPPGFASFIYDLEPGSVHDQVVESPQGFHVVMRMR